MTTFNTGNPLGSTDVYDRYDNSENLDNFSNGPLDAYADRLGVMRQSLQGIRNASQYVDLGPYAAGLVFTARNQVFSYLGEFYAPSAGLALPYTTAGAGAGEIAQFRSVGDAILRQDLAASGGSSLVGFKRLEAASVARTSLDKFIDIPSVLDFGPVDTVANTTATFQAAVNASPYIYIPPGTYSFSAITLPSNFKVLVGAGSSTSLVAAGTIADFTPWIFANGCADLQFGNFTIDMDNVAYPLNQCMQFGACLRGTVADMEIVRGGWITLFAPACADMAFDNISCEIFNQTFFLADNNPTSLRVNNLRTTHTGVGHAIGIQGGSQHKITNCRAKGGGADFFTISLYQASDSTIDSCTVAPDGREGLQATDGDRNKITNNRVFCQPGHNDFGISIFADGAAIRNCLIAGNLVVGSGGSGIAVSASYTPVVRICQLNTVSGNLILNPNQRNDVYGSGVLLLGGATCTGNIISNNSCFDESNKMRYGVNEWTSGGNPNNNKLIDNPCFGGAVFISDGNIVGVDSQLFALSDTAFQPVITSKAGTITSYTGNLWYRWRGKTLEFNLTATITDNGTGSGALIITLPTNKQVIGCVPGRAHSLSGAMLQGSVGAAGKMEIRRYDGAYPVSTGETIYLSGIMRTTT